MLFMHRRFISIWLNYLLSLNWTIYYLISPALYLNSSLHVLHITISFFSCVDPYVAMNTDLVLLSQVRSEVFIFLKLRYQLWSIQKGLHHHFGLFSKVCTITRWPTQNALSFVYLSELAFNDLEYGWNLKYPIYRFLLKYHIQILWLPRIISETIYLNPFGSAEFELANIALFYVWMNISASPLDKRYPPPFLKTL